MRDVEALVGLFRSSGRRITPQRRQIFRVLVGNDNHPTADAVWAAVREKQPAISLKTIYETLRELVEIGAIQQLHLEPGASRFDLNVETHHHLICRTCGRLVDVESAARDETRPGTAAESRYEIDHAEVIYRGRCPECVAAASGSSADPSPMSQTRRRITRKSAPGAANQPKTRAREEQDRSV